MEQIVTEVTQGDKDLINEVLDRHKKSQLVTRTREKILDRVRREIWELNNSNSPDWDVILTTNPPTGSWKPIGYIAISRILGGDHSAWVKMKRTIDARNSREGGVEVENAAGEAADRMAAS